MQTDTALENEPWYENPWVWLVIAIPSLTVVGCMFTIYLALSHPDHIVNDNAIQERSSTAQQQ